jgi:hypothetical protein
MDKGIVQTIFKDHFESYRKTRVLSRRQYHAAGSIMTCRTADQGCHINACPNGDYEVLMHNSCKHRSCPLCGSTETQLWLERRKRQALNCRYFHVTITISHDLHPLWRRNRKVFTNLMMRASWHSLKELLQDFKWLGALPGAIAVFQSWDDEMRDHCHIHMIVTAGGLTGDNRWIDVKKDRLVYTPVLASKFRGKFLAYLREGLNPLTSKGELKPDAERLYPPPGTTLQKCLNLLNRLGRKRWHADIEPPYEHANGVFKYVGRYIHRGSISEKRIIGYDKNTVRIAYAHQDKHAESDFSIPAKTFINRFLSHVPAKGSHLVRSFGLFHPNCRPRLDTARKLLGQKAYEPLQEVPNTQQLLKQMYPDQEVNICPRCGAELETVLVYRYGRSPTWRKAA